MMRKYLFVCLMLVTFACVEAPKPPEGTISKEKMVKILMDIHIAEAKVGRLSLRSVDSSKLLFRRMELKIFKKHNVDTAIYRKSFEFYLQNTTYLDEIYAATVDSLSYRESIGKMD